MNNIVKLDVELPDKLKEVGKLEAVLVGYIDSNVIPSYEPPVVDHFAPGVYCREMQMDAGTLVIGKIHKTSHLTILSKGEVTVRSQNGLLKLKAPCTLLSEVGEKRAIYAHTDVVWTTIHPTELTDVDEIEEQIIAEDYSEIYPLLSDNDSYKLLLSEVGISESQARVISDNTNDYIDMPDGAVPYHIGESDIQGAGYFIEDDILSGDVIAVSTIDSKRTDAGKYVNHATHPNAKVKGKDSKNLLLVAITDISAGTEITLNYRQVHKEVTP